MDINELLKQLKAELYGFEVIPSAMMPDENIWFRKPKSKKKRIRKKWHRDQKNWKFVPSDTAYILKRERKIIVSEYHYHKLMYELRKKYNEVRNYEGEPKRKMP